MERKETASVRTFQELSPVEKVRAVLGVVYEPVPKKLALDMTGVDIDGMEEGLQASINAVFEDEEIVSHETEEGRRVFIMDGQSKEKLGSYIDMQSVHKQITDYLWNELGLD